MVNTTKNESQGTVFPIPTSQRDSRVLDIEANVSNNFLKSTWNVSLLLENFKSIGLDVVDLVVVSCVTLNFQNLSDYSKIKDHFQHLLNLSYHINPNGNLFSRL